ncbi:MBL fold metallo-hydrolase [Crocosphaera sp. Alani8]|uniref:MBL fold metallo-hydrolase n=1 Tax=Crocosphaera sp. Alani8 TaxID=3038952 RepID=UPI00313CCA23
MNLKSIKSPKPPRLLLEDLFAFAPNVEILGGTSYFIVEKSGNVLIDCPVYHQDYIDFLRENGGVKWLFLTHRGGMSASVKSWQKVLGCQIIIQEQEAYLLPNMGVSSFEREISIAENITLIWTPGHSTGSSCLYWGRHGGVLFTGRHLLPDRQGDPAPLRLDKTFHWGRQLQSVAQLCDRFSSDNLDYICPGANTRLLRDTGLIHNAYERLRNRTGKA